MRAIQTLSLLAAVTILTATGNAAGASPRDEIYTRPGQLVPSNGTRLSLYCTGKGSPAVIFDSGFEDWAPAWSAVQPQVSNWTRACSYDRAGVGFSEPGPMPRTSVRIAEELRTALRNAGVAPPYILVGHAFGGDNVRTYAALHMDEVAGLVLVDADVTDLEPNDMQALDRRGREGFVAQLRACGDAVAGHPELPALGSASDVPKKTCAQQFFRGLPEKEWSPALNAELLNLAQTKVAIYDAFASEMEQMTNDEEYLEQHRHSFGSRPIRILTSGNHGVPADAPDREKYERGVVQAQARWLALSSDAKQVFAHTDSEYIQFDDPHAVINAIRDVYDQSKRARAK